MEEQKTKWVYAGIALLVVAVLAYISVGNKKGKTPDEERKWRVGEEQKVASLIRAGDISACDKVSYTAQDGIQYKTVCKNNIALEKATQELDYAWCKKLDDKLFSIADCKRQVMFGKLAKEKNLSVCDSAPSEELKNQCVTGYWTQKAGEEKSINVCANITDKEVQTVCKDNVYIAQLIESPKTFLCDAFSEGLKSDCEQFKKAKSETQKGFFECRTILHPRLQFACETNR